jgi:hypothetical protein
VYRIVWSFDPGETTGFVQVVSNVIFTAGTFSQDQAAETLHRIGIQDVVLYETLHCSPGFRTAGFEVIGAIKYVCQRLGVKPEGCSPTNLAGPMKWPELDPLRKIFKSPHVRDAIYHYCAWSHMIPVMGLNSVPPRAEHHT